MRRLSPKIPRLACSWISSRIPPSRAQSPVAGDSVRFGGPAAPRIDDSACPVPAPNTVAYPDGSSTRKKISAATNATETATRNTTSRRPACSRAFESGTAIRNPDVLSTSRQHFGPRTALSLTIKDRRRPPPAQSARYLYPARGTPVRGRHSVRLNMDLKMLRPAEPLDRLSVYQRLQSLEPPTCLSNSSADGRPDRPLPSILPKLQSSPIAKGAG